MLKKSACLRFREQRFRESKKTKVFPLTIVVTTALHHFSKLARECWVTGRESVLVIIVFFVVVCTKNSKSCGKKTEEKFKTRLRLEN
jgi:hypothetical protein